MSDQIFDYCIIGAGPIGIELAIEFKRIGASYIHLEAGQIGETISQYAPQTVFFSSPDRLALAGVPFTTLNQQKATKEEYLHYLRDLVEQFDLSIRTEHRVESIAHAQSLFKLEVVVSRALEMVNRETITARKIILAIGDLHHPNMLDVPGEHLSHVSHQLEDPHHYFRKDVLIIGGKNSAVEAAIRLQRVGAKVSLSYRHAELPKERIKYWLYPELIYLIRSGQVQFLPQTTLREISPKSALLFSQDLQQELNIPVDRVLLLTGYLQDKSLFNALGLALESEALKPKLNPETLEASVPGVYVIGTARAGTQQGKVTEYIETSHVHVALLIKHFFDREIIHSRQVDKSFLEN